MTFNQVIHPGPNAVTNLAQRVELFSPGLVGLSVRSPFVPTARELTRALRSRLDVPIVWGGIHPTICPDESLEDADIVCRGEGEQTLVGLVQHLESGHVWPDGMQARGGQRPSCPVRVRSLDALPDPSFDSEGAECLLGERVLPGDPLLGDDAFAHYAEPGLFEVLGSRGCTGQCSYCCAPVLGTPLIRTRSVKRVIAEIDRMRQRRLLTRIGFLDELFGADLKWLKALADAYPSAIGLPFTAEMNPGLCVRERVSLCAAAGQTGVEIGVQSGSERERREVLNRPVSDDRIVRAVSLFQEHGIAVTIDLILDNPLSTEQDLQATFRLLQRLPRPVGIKTFSLCHLPGTALTRRLLEAGVIGRHEVEDVACKTHRAWRARIQEPREAWRAFWTSLIMLAAVRKLPDQEGSWLSTMTRDRVFENVYSTEQLDELSRDARYQRAPELLMDLLACSVPASHAHQLI